MGHSRAYPVYRTTDEEAAYDRAKELCAGLELIEDEIGVDAVLADPERLLRVAEAVPDLAFEGSDQEEYDPWGEPEPDRFPVWAWSEEAPEDADLPFLAAAGDAPALLGRRGRWPGPDGSVQYDGVQVVFHHDDLELDPPDRRTETHTVFLHVHKHCPPSRVRELAARAGLNVLGEARTGW
jgi:hypothetical protein